MNKLKAVGLGLLGSAFLSVGALSIASASTNTSANNVSSTSAVPRSVMRQERLLALSQVLNTTESSVTNALHNHSLKSLVSGSGLSRKTFVTKLHAQLVSDLESKGYSQSQITIALQHRHIKRLEHRLHHS